MLAPHTLKLTAIVPLLVLLAACAPGQDANQNTAPALPLVSVAPVVTETITELNEYSGRLAAPEAVALRPRVSGHIDAVLFEDGQLVTAGTPLLRIDAKPFAARVAQLEAEQEHAQSRLSLAKAELDRARKLIKKQAIAQETFDTRSAEYFQAVAQQKAVAAALSLAQLELSYTEIKAPIDGRVSNAYTTQGNYVTAGQTVLTELVSTDRLYAYFDADERAYLAYRKAEQQGLVPNSRSGNAPVMMKLSGEDQFSHNGLINFVDNQVNARTGTIRMRAVFENSDNLLVPGLFARLQVVGSAAYDAVLIQDKAIGTDLDKKFVLVLADDNTVQYRAVTPGKKVGGLRVIESGLHANDVIVVNGLQRVRPGASVQTEQVAMVSEETLHQLQALQTRIHAISASQQLAAQSDARPATDATPLTL